MSGRVCRDIWIYQWVWFVWMWHHSQELVMASRSYFTTYVAANSTRNMELLWPVPYQWGSSGKHLYRCPQWCTVFQHRNSDLYLQTQQICSTASWAAPVFYRQLLACLLLCVWGMLNQLFSTEILNPLHQPQVSKAHPWISLSSRYMRLCTWYKNTHSAQTECPC